MGKNHRNKNHPAHAGPGCIQVEDEAGHTAGLCPPLPEYPVREISGESGASEYWLFIPRIPPERRAEVFLKQWVRRIGRA